MKKTIIAILCINILAFASNVTLDSLLEEIDATSYHNELYKNKKDINKTKEIYHRLGDFNGINTSGTIEYDVKEKKYERTGKASFGPFYIEGRNAYNEKDDSVSFGVEKSVKDLIYSSNRNELKKLKLNKEVDELSYKIDLDDEKISLINLYVEYKNNENEIRLKQASINKLSSEYNKIKMSYDLGASSKIELDSVSVNIENYKLEIGILEDSQERIKERFEYEFGINIKNSNLLDIQPKNINIKEIIKEYGNKDILKERLERDVIAENLKYTKYNSYMPDISIGAEKNTKSGEKRLFLSFSKRFFNYDIDLANEKAALSDREIQLRQSIRNNESAKLKAFNTYESYIKSYITNKNSAELEKKKYDIKLVEYEAGTASYVDVMTTFNDYMTYQIAANKAETQLYGYIYELEIRSQK